MPLRFYNTMTRNKEEFRPIDEGKVRLYTCGPTVYDFAHIGNFRAYVFEDLLKRYLLYKDYDVTHVMNLTDVDDKTIKNSIKEGVALDKYTERYKEAFFEDIETLKLHKADHYPSATETIDEMVAIIKKLLEKDIAYRADNSIYFRISKFPEYGRLSHMDMSQLKAGARVTSDEYEKETVSDFALWKGWDEDDGDVYWETELGQGRPGWHIECSAMSSKYLGNHFDIHCGGVDNIFPHHENEIAQSEAANDQKFVNYWMHNEHLIVEGRKMSKSLGNFFTLRDLLEKGYPGVVVRYLLISTHYRQQLNFTFDGLEAAKKSLERLWDFHDSVEAVKGGTDNPQVEELVSAVKRKFVEALDDDLNVSPALAAIFDFVRDVNRLISEGNLSENDAGKVLDAVNGFDNVLAFLKREKSDASLEDEVEQLIQQRIDARKNKDFATADKIRDDLLERGIILEDTPQGTKWKRKL